MSENLHTGTVILNCYIGRRGRKGADYRSGIWVEPIRECEIVFSQDLTDPLRKEIEFHGNKPIEIKLSQRRSSEGLISERITLHIFPEYALVKVKGREFQLAEKSGQVEIPPFQADARMRFRR